MKLAILALTFLAGAAAPAAGSAESPAPAAPATAGTSSPSLWSSANSGEQNCLPIARQVAGEDKGRRSGTRLDQQPPAQLLLAVDRQVDGCREATIIRRDVAAPAR